MKEKYNFQIDESNKTVVINVSPSVFPKLAILQAAYHFIEDGKVIVDGNDDKITVTLISEGKSEEADLEELAYEFNIQLISSAVEGVEGEKYARLREQMMRVALMPQQPSQEK